MEPEKKRVHIHTKKRVSDQIQNKKQKRKTKKKVCLNQENENQLTQHEDAAMKTAIRYLSEEGLEFFNISGEVKGIAPTESVHLELKKLYQDFNLIMMDGSWKHFEFQSSDKGIKDLKRFRSYEAVTSQQNDIPVTTYVLYSGNIKNPVTEFTEGINTYRVVPLILQDYDAETYFSELTEKIKNKRKLEKKDLVPLALCPLMGGDTTQKERIKKAFEILKDATGLEETVVQKIEAVVYTMASKFLKEEEMEEIKEGLKMTKLGQMLWDSGKQDGMALGMQRGMERGKELGLQNGIKAMIESCKELNVGKEQIFGKLKEKFNLTKEQAEDYLEKYW